MRNCLLISRVSIAALGCLFGSAIPLLAQITLPPVANASISGVVEAGDGSPLSAVVTATRFGRPPMVGHVVTGSDGSFTIKGLTAGTYAVCGSVRGGGYLDPCIWNLEVPTVQIATGQAISGHRLVLAKGSLLQVRFNDTAAILGTAGAPGEVGPHILIGVFTDRRTWVSLAIVAKDALGRSLQTTIPFDKNITLHFVGSGVQVKDGTGAAVSIAGTTVTVNHSSTATAAYPVLTYQVSPQ